MKKVNFSHLKKEGWFRNMVSLNQKLVDRRNEYQEILNKLLDNRCEFGELTKREIELLTYCLEGTVAEIDKILKTEDN